MTHKYHVDGTLPSDPKVIFVFGSNLAGIHGAGAAKAAVDRYGAKIGNGKGWQAYMRSFAIPTKDKKLNTLPMADIEAHVREFVTLTNSVQMEWFVTRVGCGLAGLKDSDIAPLFRDAKNCSFAEQWKPYLE